MSIERYELTDVQWNPIKDLFPEYRTGRLPENNCIMMFNAILWVARNDAALLLVTLNSQRLNWF